MFFSKKKEERVFFFGLMAMVFLFFSCFTFAKKSVQFFVVVANILLDDLERKNEGCKTNVPQFFDGDFGLW